MWKKYGLTPDLPVPVASTDVGVEPQMLDPLSAQPSDASTFPGSPGMDNPQPDATTLALSSSETVTFAGSGIVFNNTYTANVTQPYKNSILAAEQDIATHWTNSIALNVTFDAQAPGTNGTLASNRFGLVEGISYATLKSELAAHATSADAQAAVASLPATDPSGGTGWSLPVAYARLLQISQSTPTTDDTVTLNTSYNWTFGQDVIATVEHELTEGGMGRIGALGKNTDNAGHTLWSTMDLFRYSASGVRDFTDGQDGSAAFFSVDGNQLLLQFNNQYSGATKVNNGDTADFIASDVFGTGSPGDSRVLSSTDLKVMNVLGWNPAAPAGMKADYFYAVESKTGDFYDGFVYDNSGRYSLGSTYTSGTDQLGGTWTYTVSNVVAADGLHQDSSYAGKVYDYYYYDADIGAAYNPGYGYKGGVSGSPTDKTYYSGTNYLGSDLDAIDLNGAVRLFGGGYYVVPEQSTMKADYFHAVESKTGDWYDGFVYDNSGRYSLGSTYTSGTDQLGGNWTYTVTSVSNGDIVHQDSSYAGKVYDYYYYDADAGAAYSPGYGYKGGVSGSPSDKTYYSGTNYLGSDLDAINVNGTIQLFGQGYYVVPEQPTMKVDYFHTVESATGDWYDGFVYDNSGRYSLGSTYTFGTDQLGGTWTYTVTSVSNGDSVHQDPSYAGMVYDYYYYDADTGAAYSPYFGYAGGVNGSPTDKSYYSGTNYLGSDDDVVYVNGTYQLFGLGYYVVPESGTATSVQPPTSGAEVLDGSLGNQTLVAGNIPAVFIGGSNDVLIGGDSSDTFIFRSTNFGQNAITNFNPENDTIQFDHTVFENFAAVQAHSQQIRADTVLTLDADNAITLQGVAISSLHERDFLFV